MNLNIPNLDRQIRLEEEMLQLGVEAYQTAVRKAEEKGRESTLPPGVTLMQRNVGKVAGAITQFIVDSDNGKPGKRTPTIGLLKQIDPKVAAMLALRGVLEGVSRRRVLQSVAVLIGSHVEDQIRYSSYDRDEKGLFRSVQNKLKGSTSYRHQRTVMNTTFNKLGLSLEPWTEKMRLHLGIKLIDLVQQSTGWTQTILMPTAKGSKAKTPKYLVPSAELLTWLSDANSRCEILSPMLLPTVIPPRDWTSPFDGGYYLCGVGDNRRMNLVKKGATYLEEMSNKAGEMPVVYEAVNALQRTAWKVNTSVLEVMKNVWDNNLGVAGVPSQAHVDAVACPSCGTPIYLRGKQYGTAGHEDHGCFTDDKELHTAWKKRAAMQYQANHRLLSKRIQFTRMLWIAEKFSAEAEIFMPYQLDFRGRAYAVPQFNPQGDDATKSLLTFSKGAPIGDGTGPGWLAIQGANVFGEDKISLEDRITFIEDNSDRIVAIAAEPMSDLWWADADKPFQFLAFCFEWAGYKAEGASFVSHLPVALDGSCSGIQHFSAMLRDERGGRCVNLLPSDKPSDIYQQVADIVVSKMEKDSTADNKKSAYSKALLELGITRKATKRQVMTLPYGSKKFSCRTYTDQWVQEAVAAKGVFPYADVEGATVIVRDRDQWSAMLGYMTDLIWDSIGEVVVSSRTVMQWLQDCTKLVTAENTSLTWTTPVGFPVMHRYVDQKGSVVKTMMNDVVVKLTVVEDTLSIDRDRMHTAVSPNFVHSLDAAHLQMSVVVALDNGIDNFAMIHDSFGTHAANAELFGRCLRHAFVDMYEGNDVLASFRDSVINVLPESKHDDVPPVPDSGSLDLKEVLKSDFFFA